MPAQDAFNAVFSRIVVQALRRDPAGLAELRRRLPRRTGRLARSFDVEQRHSAGGFRVVSSSPYVHYVEDKGPPPDDPVVAEIVAGWIRSRGVKRIIDGAAAEAAAVVLRNRLPQGTIRFNSNARR